jgi:hypothetical protein
MMSYQDRSGAAIFFRPRSPACFNLRRATTDQVRCGTAMCSPGKRDVTMSFSDSPNRSTSSFGSDPPIPALARIHPTHASGV